MDPFEDIKAAQAELAKLGRPLVAFEVGNAAWEAIKTLAKVPLKASRPVNPLMSKLDGVPVRHCSHLCSDICLPVYIDKDGYETWGEPIWLSEEGRP